MGTACLLNSNDSASEQFADLKSSVPIQAFARKVSIILIGRIISTIISKLMHFTRKSCKSTTHISMIKTEYFMLQRSIVSLKQMD